MTAEKRFSDVHTQKGKRKAFDEGWHLTSETAPFTMDKRNDTHRTRERVA
jgi:hypothetical protein